MERLGLVLWRKDRKLGVSFGVFWVEEVIDVRVLRREYGGVFYIRLGG